MTDDDPQRVLIGIDWRSVGLAAGLVATVALIAWAAWAALSWLFGTTGGRFVLAMAVLLTALYVILTDDEVDLDEAVNEANAAAEPQKPDDAGEPENVCDDCGREFDSPQALAGHRSVHGGENTDD